MSKLHNIHPGEILYEVCMQPMALSKNALAKQMGVPATRIGEITLGRRAITADTDLHLAKVFGTSEAYWLSLQNACSSQSFFSTLSNN